MKTGPCLARTRTAIGQTPQGIPTIREHTEALRIAREAAESSPIEEDAILGVNFLLGLAQIEAHTGQSKEAIKTLRQLLTIPAEEYVPIARLKIDPSGTQSVTDPGFQKLLSEPEPETVYK